MPLLSTRGAASAQGFGEFAKTTAATYIEDVFSTWLYTGNGSTQTITNGIDLAGKGGLVWGKIRSGTTQSHYLADTARGTGKYLSTNNTDPQTVDASSVTAFNSNGFSIGNGGDIFNTSTYTYASWTFRKQPKFFDVVTWTGNGVYPRNIPHNLGSVPGCIIVKDTSFSLGTNWLVYHQDMGAAQVGYLNLTSAFGTSTSVWNATSPTATQFTVGSSLGNTNGNTYVAYLFAHNAGGFGLTGTDNVISCGSYTGNANANGPVINLGYEPQWVLIKNTSQATNWFLADNMRGWTAGGSFQFLGPNLADAEGPSSSIKLTSTGFQIGDPGGSLNGSGNTLIYIAIRRGPMKTPTSGTSVYGTGTKQSSSPAFVTGIVTDLGFYRNTTTAASWYLQDRLRGQVYSTTNTTDAETVDTDAKFDYQNGFYVSASANTAVRGWGFRRAPGFFDVVCYTGTGSGSQSVAHNLGVAPELMIIKRRNAAATWIVGTQFTGSGFLYNGLNGNAADNATYNGGFGWYSQPTSTSFAVENYTYSGASGSTYVAYLFASCPGVSKIGTYTGNGGTQTINCGFAARFVLIKRTNNTGNWVTWDTARGMVAGTDPRLELNTTNAETNANWVYTDASGFQLVTSDATVNASGGSYIYLCIA